MARWCQDVPGGSRWGARLSELSNWAPSPTSPEHLEGIHTCRSALLARRRRPLFSWGVLRPGTRARSPNRRAGPLRRSTDPTAYRLSSSAWSKRQMNPCSTRPVGGRPVLDVEDDHHALVPVDLEQDAPLASESGAVDAGQRVMKRFAHPAWVVEEWPGDELRGRDRNVRGQPIGQRTTCRWCGSQLVTLAHEAWRPRTRLRTASAP